MCIEWPHRLRNVWKTERGDITWRKRSPVNVVVAATYWFDDRGSITPSWLLSGMTRWTSLHAVTIFLSNRLLGLFDLFKKRIDNVFWTKAKNKVEGFVVTRTIDKISRESTLAHQLVASPRRKYCAWARMSRLRLGCATSEYGYATLCNIGRNAIVPTVIASHCVERVGPLIYTRRKPIGALDITFLTEH